MQRRTGDDAARQQKDVLGRHSLLMIVEGSLFIALSYLLSFIRIYRMPQGGEVSLEMVPLILFSLLRGAIPGILAGAIFGLIHFLQSPMMFHPLQVILDYPCAFGALGLAGFFSKAAFESASRKKPLSLYLWAAVLVSVSGRFLFHMLSAALFLSLFLRERLEHPFLYSLAYNASYLIPGLIISGFCVQLIFPRLMAFRR